MNKILAIILTMLVLSSCKKSNDLVSDEGKTPIDKPARQLTKDLIYAPGMPDADPPSYCMIGPEECNDIVSASVGYPELYDLVNAVQLGTYATWLSNTDNYNAIMSIAPEYEEYYQECILGNKTMVYYLHTPNSREAAILIGDQAETTFDTHDASLVFAK